LLRLVGGFDARATSSDARQESAPRTMHAAKKILGTCLFTEICPF